MDVKLAELTDTIGRKPMLLNNFFDDPDLWRTIGEIGSELKEGTVKVFLNMTEKCAQIERKFQMLISVASTEVSELNQKRVEPLKMIHEAARDLVKDVAAPRIISNMTRIDALENNSLNIGLSFGVAPGGGPLVDIA